MKIESSRQLFTGRTLRLLEHITEPKRVSEVFEDLINVIQEVAALHQQDVVDVGAGGRLVQGQAAKTNVSGKVFVQHPSSCKQ